MSHKRIISSDEQKSIALEILIHLYDFCKRQNLRMYLAYGTLIGAARHQGYIPWDDDIDILMPREDYDKLLATYKPTSKYRLVSHSSSPFYNKAFATLNDERTYKEEYSIRKKYRKDLCINVDIFPLDYVPEEKSEQDRHFHNVSQRFKYIQCLVWKFSKGSSLKKTLQKNSGIVLMRILEFLRKTSVQDQLSRVTAEMTRYNLAPTSMVGCLANPFVNGKREIMPAEIFDGERFLTFEGHEFPVPAKYDEFLTRIYGDWKKLPPEEKRHPHHLSICYWK